MDTIALVFVFVVVILIAAIVVALGSLPKKIALQRGHPYPDAVGAASWIGLATGVLWPLAFVWAFVPAPAGGESAAPAGSGDPELQARIDELEALVAKLQSEGNAS